MAEEIKPKKEHKWHPQVFKIPTDKIFRENLRRYIVELTPIIEGKKFEHAVMLTLRYINKNLGQSDASTFYFAATLIALATAKLKSNPTQRAVKNLKSKMGAK